jgi:hypothetical protein
MDRLERREVNQLDTPAVEEGVGEQGIGPFIHMSCEGRIDVADRAGFEHLDCNPMARAAAPVSLAVVSPLDVVAFFAENRDPLSRKML